MKIKLSNLKETESFGLKLGSLLMPGDILCLNGDLGAGKTTMTQSIGKGLGVDDYITSPTFTLINEYKGRIWVYHFDVYRLENVEDLYDIGFDEYFYGHGVCIIEWAEKIEKLLPEDRIVIDIKKGKETDERILSISGQGSRYKEIIKELDNN
ncbi:MAG TPA: tRNA (adenosine(37)-N6)-threonylcarbamoyltransferase complex ATPase subunit type 1 TsaE [Tissierellaceae bacterium]|nr:tRNA (adenosine(37)-N6)-threonylcarbamoyltransferase complex ATPase subunit type 1 TsaE [Tissierellaceae bacterium]